jgi:hypothetical protein
VCVCVLCGQPHPFPVSRFAASKRYSSTDYNMCISPKNTHGMFLRTTPSGGSQKPHAPTWELLKTRVANSKKPKPCKPLQAPMQRRSNRQGTKQDTAMQKKRTKFNVYEPDHARAAAKHRCNKPDKKGRKEAVERVDADDKRKGNGLGHLGKRHGSARKHVILHTHRVRVPFLGLFPEKAPHTLPTVRLGDHRSVTQKKKKNRKKKKKKKKKTGKFCENLFLGVCFFNFKIPSSI